MEHNIDSKSEILLKVKDMDDQRSIGSSRDGDTSQVIDEKDLATKISVTEEAKLDNRKEKITE